MKIKKAEYNEMIEDYEALIKENEHIAYELETLRCCGNCWYFMGCYNREKDTMEFKCEYGKSKHPHSYCKKWAEDVEHNGNRMWYREWNGTNGGKKV